MTQKKPKTYHSASRRPYWSLRVGTAAAAGKTAVRLLPRSLFLLVCITRITPVTASAEEDFQVPQPIAGLLQAHCADCHSGDSPEAGIAVDTLAQQNLQLRLDFLNKVQEQIFFGLMPPQDSPQLSTQHRTQLLGWMSGELRQHSAAMLDEKLQRPEYGNYVDHDQLFSGEYRHLPGATADRRWLISEFIFDARMNHIVDHPGRRTIDGVPQNVVGDNGVGLGTRFGGQSLRQRITNPFLLPEKIGVRYYSLDSLTNGHLLTMISNARKIAEYMVSEQTMKAHYPAMAGIMQLELKHRNVLRSRKQFLTDHMARLLQDLYPEDNDALLPEFVRMEIPDPPPNLNRDGTPRLETNLELLQRYDDGDLRAVYLGIGLYNKADASWDQVIEQCEQDWFIQGLHPKRIESRVSILKVMHTNWDMKVVLDDVAKKNIRPPKWKPLEDPEMQILRQTVLQQRQQDDSWQQIIDRCMNVWTSEFRTEREASGATADAQLTALIEELFAKILERQPSPTEVQRNIELLRTFMAQLPTQDAIARLVESLLLSSELVYRTEFGSGPADEHGRRMMSPRDASYALSFAITDSSPDDELIRAAAEGRLNSREDYRREVTRLLQRRDQYYVIDESVQKGSFNASITNTPIRKLRFFREFFGYPAAMKVFKDDTRFGAGRNESAVSRLVDEADMLVDHILTKDTNVFEELLTTENFFVFHSGDNQAMQESCDRLKTIYNYFRRFEWQDFSEEDLYEHWDFIDQVKMRGTVFNDFLNSSRRKGWVATFKRIMTSLEERLGNGQQNAMPYDETNMAYWHKGNATGRTGQVMREHQVTTYFNIDYRDWDYPAQQPTPIPHRRGLLTHPAWLIAHSLNTETDPVRRGKWVLEKLLAGTVPDVPITVDAVIPQDPEKTLRQRLENKTSDAYCRSCHNKMDPLGLPFEIFDDFGRYRTEERLEHEQNLLTEQKQAPLVEGVQLAVYRTLPVVASGQLNGTGNPALDGEVTDAFDLVSRLAQSDRVRQSIIRHAFRYFLGRNETLSDSATLMDADEAYLTSGGSFDAVIVSLLTSDSFIYRRPSEILP